jgi:hypothetical protein
MPKRKDTYLGELDELPPFKCWLIARHPNRMPITQEELAQRTGWDRKKVERFCGLTTWGEVTVRDADLFRQACGITRSNLRYHRWYLKRTQDLTRTVTGLTPARKRPVSAQRRLVRLLTASASAASGADARAA